MKKKIISHLRSRGLNEIGEARLNIVFDLVEFLGKLIMIPFVMIGIFFLGYLMNIALKLILNF